MSDDNTHFFKAVEKLEAQQAETNGELRTLSQKIGDLVTAIARREVHDENMTRRIDDIENRTNNHAKRISELEKSQAGHMAEKKLIDWILKPAVGIVVGVILYSAFKAYTG
jgi:regulator of replication initiation timing